LCTIAKLHQKEFESSRYKFGWRIWKIDKRHTSPPIFSLSLPQRDAGDHHLIEQAG
jgi:hypothetical protein